MKKYILAILIGIIFTLPFQAWAESTAANMDSTFELGVENGEKITASVNAAYTFIRNYGTDVSPIALENDAFDKAYPYQCYGGGSNNRWDNIFKMKFDIPEAEDNDCVWLSYYYKSATSFVGGDGNTYTGTTMDIQQQRNTTNQIVTNLKAGAYGDTFIADDEWHRVDLYMSAANIKEKELLIYFTDMSKPMYVLFAGFRAGVVHFPEGESYNNDRAYTELGWHLQNTNADTIILNGKTVNLEQGVYEYNLSADEDALTAELPEGSAAAVSEVKKISGGCYEVWVTAPGYSRGGSDDTSITFRRRVNSSTGEFLSNGTVETYTVKNSQMVKKYTVNLVLRTAEAALTVDGEEKSALDGCVGGEEIVLDVKYRNLKAENKTYIAVLVIYKDKAVKAVIPAREEITPEQSEVSKAYTYVLPEDDYTGCTADFLVIDTETMYDVVK